MRLPRISIVAFVLVALFCLPSLIYTGSYIVSDTPVPLEGAEPSPYPDDPLTEGFLFVVLDGGRKDMMSDPSLMPNLNRRVQDGAYLEVRTNPLTMTAMCVKEMATGVPSRPNEALQNFHPQHPGSPDDSILHQHTMVMKTGNQTIMLVSLATMSGKICLMTERRFRFTRHDTVMRIIKRETRKASKN